MKSHILKSTETCNRPREEKVSLRTHKAIIARLKSLRRYTGDPRKPNILHIAITDKCNMKCPNCLYRNDNKNFNIISADRAEALIREINSPIVLLSGGEPLLGGEILQTTRRVAGISRELGKITGILTNGVTLNQVVKDNYPEFRPSSGFFFQISIDGLKDMHDKLRGNFERIVENIRFAKEAGHLIYTNTVVSKHNIHELRETMEFISGLSDRMYLNPILTSDFDSADKEALDLLGDYITDRQDMMIGNSVVFGKFLKGQMDLKCMFHSLISITPSGRIKFPCYCYEDGSEYPESFTEFLDKVKKQRDYFENKSASQCRNCYTHCLHEAHTYAEFYWQEIIEQIKRPGCAYKKYIRPLLTSRL